MAGSGGFSASVGQPLTFLIVMARTAPEGSSRNRSTAAFVESFSANLPKLVASGYPKWREVNIAATIPDAQRFEAARRWLAARTPDAGPPQFTSSGSSAVGSGILMLRLHGFDEAVGACMPQSRRADGFGRHRIVAAAAGVCRSTQTASAAHSRRARSAQTNSRSLRGCVDADRRAPGA